jgi:phage/plasmid-like protein (TIGR03299 family)
MAAEVESMAYVGQVPWHKSGFHVTNEMTLEEFQDVSGTNWTVEKVPSFILINGVYVPNGSGSLIRNSDNKILTNLPVLDTWNPVQNKEGFEFFRDAIQKLGWKVETAGSLKGGQRVWVLVKLPESFAILKGKDQTDLYFLFTISHKYGEAIDIRLTMIRVVCMNTLMAALRGKSEVCLTLNHRRPFDAEEAKKALGLAQQSMTEYKEAVEFLASKRFKFDDALKFYTTVFPLAAKTVADKPANDNVQLSRAAQKAWSVLNTQPGAELGEGTYWQLFNSVTYATDHLLGRSEDTRLHSAWYGPNKAKKVVALNTALELAKAA